MTIRKVVNAIRYVLLVFFSLIDDDKWNEWNFGGDKCPPLTAYLRMYKFWCVFVSSIYHSFEIFSLFCFYFFFTLSTYIALFPISFLLFVNSMIMAIYKGKENILSHEQKLKCLFVWAINSALIFPWYIYIKTVSVSISEGEGNLCCMREERANKFPLKLENDAHVKFQPSRAKSTIHSSHHHRQKEKKQLSIYIISCRL